jgi:hypothetical protein
MAGCYGNDSFDRYWESQLDKYLDEYDDDDDDDDLDDQDDEDDEY